MKKILIVEDEKDAQTLYNDILGEKYELDFASDVDQAKKKLESNGFIDLMILDIILPKKTGDSFFVELKGEAKYQDLKVLCVSILGDVVEGLRKYDEKLEFLAKPIKSEELMKAVFKLIRD